MDRRVFQDGTDGDGIPVRVGADAAAKRSRVLKDGKSALQLPLRRSPQISVLPQYTGNAFAPAFSVLPHEPVQDGCLGKRLPPWPPLSPEVLVRLLLQQPAYIPHGGAKVARRMRQAVKSGLDGA